METRETRYSRQLAMPDIGEDGQRRLSASRVLVVGAGGLGSTLLYALAGAGVGHIRIVDADVVSPSNLNRQFLYTPADVGKPKALLARERLLAYNPEIDVEALQLHMDDAQALRLCSEAGLAVAAVDNMDARFALNRACAASRIPLAEGAVDGWHGRVALVRAGLTPCLRCLYGEAAAAPPPSVGAMVMTVASMLSVLAIRALLGLYDEPFRLIYVNGAQLSLDALLAKRDPSCPVCGAL